MKHTLTFPQPTDPEVFPYEVDGVLYEIPRLTDVVNGFGFARRLIEKDIPDKATGVMTLIAFGLAHEDDERRIRVFDRLSQAQQIEIFDKWGAYTGADLGESSGPTDA